MLNHSELENFLSIELPNFLSGFRNKTLRKAVQKTQEEENSQSHALLNTLNDIIGKNIHALEQMTEGMHFDTTQVEIDAELNELYANFHHNYGFIHFIPESSEQQGPLTMERLEAYYRHQPIGHEHNIILCQNNLYAYSSSNPICRLVCIPAPDSFSTDSDHRLYRQFINIIRQQTPYAILNSHKEITQGDIQSLLHRITRLPAPNVGDVLATVRKSEREALICRDNIHAFTHDISYKRKPHDISLLKSIILKTLSILNHQKDNLSAKHAQMLKWFIYSMIVFCIIGITCYLLWPALIFANIPTAIMITEISLIPLIVLGLKAWRLNQNKNHMIELIDQLNNVHDIEASQQRSTLYQFFNTHEQQLQTLFNPTPDINASQRRRAVHPLIDTDQQQLQALNNSYVPASGPQQPPNVTTPIPADDEYGIDTDDESENSIVMNY